MEIMAVKLHPLQCHPKLQAFRIDWITQKCCISSCKMRFVQRCTFILWEDKKERKGRKLKERGKTILSGSKHHWLSDASWFQKMRRGRGKMYIRTDKICQIFQMTELSTLPSESLWELEIYLRSLLDKASKGYFLTSYSFLQPYKRRMVICW